MTSADLEELLRWEGAGGTWRLARRSAGAVELDLLTCGHDEVMGQLCSEEPDLVAHVDRQGEDEGGSA